MFCQCGFQKIPDDESLANYFIQKQYSCDFYENKIKITKSI